MNRSISRSRNEITVNLEGGVGNQLFQYFAGLYAAKNLNVPLKLNLSRVINNRHSGFNILEFNLPGSPIVELKTNLPDWDSRISRKLRNLSAPFLGHSRHIYSNGIGYDGQIDLIRNGDVISGYFQSWKFAQQLINNGVDIHGMLPLNPTHEYLDLKSEAEEKRPVVVHIRRGDYLGHNERFGLLSREYYLNALNRFREKSNGEIWVFSDEFSSAQEIFGVRNRRLRYMSETSMWHPIHVMKVMSSASTNIIANSTFSWWSAFLNKEVTNVIVPNPWFKSLMPLHLLIPDSWESNSAIWL
jgi:hypothetical protein